MLKEGQLPSARALARFADREGLSIPELSSDHRFALPEISVRKGYLGYFTKLKNANGRSDSVETLVEETRPTFFQTALKWSPAAALPLVAALGIAAGGGGEAHADGPQPTPNPHYIPNEEEPNPAGPDVAPGVEIPGDSTQPGSPANNPPEPVHIQEPHEEFYQLTHKEMFDSNGNRIPEWGVDARWDQQFRYWEDLNLNMRPDPGEGLQSNLRTGPDGVEVIHDSVIDDVEGVSICVEDTNVDPNVRLVTPAVQCADVDPASLTVEIQSLVENIPAPTPQPPPPTPTATPTPQPTEEPKPTPTAIETRIPPSSPPAPAGPPAVQLKVCPDGQVLPDAFQISAPSIDAARLEEIKCEILGLAVDHDKQMQMLELLRTGQLQELELLMGKDLDGDGIIGPDFDKDGKADAESIPAQFDDVEQAARDAETAARDAEEAARDAEEEAKDKGGPDWLTRGLLIGGIAGGSVLGFLGMRSITGRLDRLIDRGQPPAGPVPTEGGPEPEGPEEPEEPQVPAVPAPEVAEEAAVPEEAQVARAHVVEKDGKKAAMLSEDQFDQLFRLFTAGIDKLSDEDLEELITPQLRQILADLNLITAEQAMAMSNREIAEAAKPLAEPVLAYAAVHPEKVRELQERAKGKAGENGEVTVKDAGAPNNGAARDTEAKDQTPTVGVEDVEDKGVGGVKNGDIEAPTRVKVKFQGGDTEVYLGRKFTRRSGTAYEVTEIGPAGDHFVLLNKRENKLVRYGYKQMVSLIIEDRERRAESRKTMIGQATAQV